MSWRYFRSTLLTAVLLAAGSSNAQKQQPAALIPQSFILLDSVVTEQWPSMPLTVNLPGEPTVLNPGQCVRVGVVASGSDSEHFLDGIAIHAIITTGSAHDELPLQPSTASRFIRAESDAKVSDILAAAGVKSPLPVAALAVSSSKWCVPLDAHDGKATFTEDVDLNGKHMQLKSLTIHIESIATGAAASFSDQKQLGDWTMSYDTHPEPARLLAAIRFLGAQEQPDLNAIEFLIAAFAHDSATASQFGPTISQFDKQSRLLGVTVGSSAKVTFVHPPVLDREERDRLAAMPDLPDPYDLSSSPQPWQNLDLLWAQFLATGNRKPVATITQALLWKSDYDAYLEIKKQGRKVGELTPSIAHGVTYGAAQWSLGSFYRTDPIAADYIRSIRDDASTPQPIRDALQNLNPGISASSGH